MTREPTNKPREIFDFDEDISRSAMDKMLKDYFEKLCREQESLVCKYMLEYGLHPNDVVIVERETPTGRIIYPELKSKFPLALESELDRYKRALEKCKEQRDVWASKADDVYWGIDEMDSEIKKILGEK